MEGKYTFNSPEWQDISGKKKIVSLNLKKKL